MENGIPGEGNPGDFFALICCFSSWFRPAQLNVSAVANREVSFHRFSRPQMAFSDRG
jgi:hypothetical protein